MSNYKKENLIQIPPAAVPTGTLALKVGDVIFTPGNIRITNGTEFYKCASVNTANKTWTGYRAVLKEGFYQITDEEKTLEYSSFTPEIGKIYPDDMSGIFTPFQDPSMVPVINDQNTVFLLYPSASEGRIENIGMGKDQCTGDFTCDMTVENNKLKSGGHLTLPSGYLPVNALNQNTEWTFDIWFDLDIPNLGSGDQVVMSSNAYSSSDTWLESRVDGTVVYYNYVYSGAGANLNQQFSTLEYPITPRRITLEQWLDNETMKSSVYLDGKCVYTDAKIVGDKLVSHGVIFPGRQGFDTWFAGHYAMISVRTVADHRGQSFEMTVNPYS